MAVGTVVKRPPGPRGLAAARWPMEWVRDTYGYLPKLARKYGDVVDLPLPVPGMTFTLVSHPEHVAHIMTRNHHRYAKHIATNQLVSGDPPALPLLVGDEWKTVRRVLNPRFTEKALAEVSHLMAAGVTERIDLWGRFADTGERVDLEHELGAVVMAGLMRSMFGDALDAETIDKAVDASREYGRYVVRRAPLYWLPQFLPRPLEGKGRAAQNFANAMLDDLIAKRKANPTDVPDVVNLLMGLRYEDGTALDHYRLRSELNGLVFAGFETTAEALAWTIGLLCLHPAARAKAYEEVDALGGEPVRYEHLKRLPYLRACFDEAQRFQAAPANIRTALEDDEIGGYLIPKGSHVMISPYGLHRDPRFWQDPDVFQPSRFLTDEINKNAFIPFNVGPRKCMGARMAYLEALFVLATAFQRFTFEAPAGWRPRHQIRVSTGLKDGLPVLVHSR